MHVQVCVPTNHMQGTVPVFESKTDANARVHTRTHASRYRIPSICSLRCPMPHACKQVLNMCPTETMNIIVLLLSLGQRLSTYNWPCHMEAPLVCNIHGGNLIIHIMPLAPFRSFMIPNENIRRCPGGQPTNPNDVTKTINGNRNFIYAPGVFQIEEEITKDASYGSDGHAVHVMCDKIRKVWNVVPLRQCFRPSNFNDNTIQIRTNTMQTYQPSLLRASCCSTKETSTPMRWSVLHEKNRAIQMFVWGYLIMPILLPTLLGTVGMRGLRVPHPNSRGQATKHGL